MRCEYRKYKKERLCVSDLTKVATLISRAAVGESLFDTVQSITQELVIKQAYCAMRNQLVQNRTSDVRHNGINIGSDATHLISFRFKDVSDVVFDPAVVSLEVELIRYRVMSVVNVGENNEIVDCHCVVRGDVGSNQVRT
jgi:hypothetical protein